MMDMKDICTNCGQRNGLHHFETDQCPAGGDNWSSLTFNSPSPHLPDMDALHACASCGGEEIGRVLYWSYPTNSAPVCLCEDCVVLVKS